MRALTVLLIAVFTQGQPPPAVISQTKDAQSFFGEGVELTKSQRWAEAQAKYKEVRAAESDWTKEVVKQAIKLELDACIKQGNPDEVLKLLTEYRSFALTEPVSWRLREHWYQDKEFSVALKALEHLEYLREQLIELTDSETERGKAVPQAIRAKLHTKLLPISKRLSEMLIGPNVDLQKQWDAKIESEVWWTNDWHKTAKVTRSDEAYFFDHNQDGLRCDEKGKPRFTPLVDKYSTELIHGAKILYLLREVERLDQSGDGEEAALSLLRRAIVARQLYGPMSNQQWKWDEMYYQFDRKPSFLERGLNRLSKRWWELTDNEVITQVLGRAEVVVLPDGENPLALLRELERRYPDSSWVPESIYQRGLYYQSRQQYERAKTEYATLVKRFGNHRRAKDAERQKEIIDSGDVLLGRTKVYAAGTKAELWYAHRQTEEVEFTAKVFDVKRYLGDVVAGRKRNFHMGYVGEYLISDIDSDDGPDDPDNLRKYVGPEKASWTQKLNRSERVATAKTLLPFSDLGVYVIEARLPGQRTASKGLLVFTDRSIMVQQIGPDQLLYVADAKTGRPVAGQEIVLGSEENFSLQNLTRVKTDANGIILHKSKKQRESDVIAFAISPQGGVVMCSLEHPYYEKETAKEVAAVLTDRPIYRPGDTVQFRLWHRRYKESAYQLPKAGEKISLALRGPARQLVKQFELVTDQYGGASGSYVLNREVPLGKYTLTVSHGEEHWTPECGFFFVEEYKKPEFEVKVSTETVADRMRVRLTGNYYFGGPVANGEVYFTMTKQDTKENQGSAQPFDWLYGAGYGQSESMYSWLIGTSLNPSAMIENEEVDPWGRSTRVVYRSGRLPLNAQGELDIDLDTKTLNPSGEPIKLRIEAWMRDKSRRTIKGSGHALLGTRKAEASIGLDGNWYSPGSRASAEIAFYNPDGSLQQTDASVILEKVTYPDGVQQSPKFETKQRIQLRTNPKGQTAVSLPLQDAGQYRVTVRDEKQTAVSTVLWVYDRGISSMSHRCPDVEIIPDKRTYQIGDTARILIVTNQVNARVFWSDDLGPYWSNTYRFFDLTDGVGVIELKIDQKHMPIFYVRAALVSNGESHQKDCALYVPPVNRLLTVSAVTDRNDYRPGQNGQVNVKVSDHSGKPIQGQVTLSVFDKAVTAIAPDSTSRLNEFLTTTVREAAQVQQSSPSWGNFRSSGRFVCPQFEVYDGDRFMGGMGGAPPTGGDPSDAGSARPGNKREPHDKSTEFFDVDLAVRKDFSDTALWRAVVETGADGVSVQPIHLPDSLTTWRVRADAITDNTQIGGATHELVVSKPLVIRIQLPRFLIEGDTVTISAVVNSSMLAPTAAEVELVVPEKMLEPIDQLGTKKGEQGTIVLRKQLQLQSKESQRLDWSFKVRTPGALKIQAAIRSSEAADIMELTLPILQKGQMVTHSYQGTIRIGEKTSSDWKFAIPQQVIPGETRLEVSLSSGPVGAVLDALPFLMDYPYGCVEQTMSRFYPTVIASHAIKRLGINLKDLEVRKNNTTKETLADRFTSRHHAVFDPNAIRRMEDSGLARLLKFQHKDGGWGWWENDTSTPYMTAYVLIGLHESVSAGSTVPSGMLDEGYHYLTRAVENHEQNQQEGMESQSATRAFIIYALTLGGSSTIKDRYNREFITGAADRTKKLTLQLYADRKNLNRYARVMTLLALDRLKLVEESKKLLNELLLELERNIKTGEAHLSASPGDWWRWSQNEIEINSWLLRAIARISPNHADAPLIATWLVANREGGFYWRSTRDSALAIAALAEFLVLTGGPDKSSQVSVLLDGRPIRETTLSLKDAFKADSKLTLTEKELPVGDHTLTIKGDGRAVTFIAGQLRYFSKRYETPNPAGDLAIERTYHVIDAVTDRVKEPVLPGTVLSSGTLIEVAITITAKEPYAYCAFIDPRPAGGESAQLHSGGLWNGSAWINIEHRDEQTQFFIEQLKRGTQTIKYRIRLETPGVFEVAPAYGFAMYAPRIRAWSLPCSFSVK